MKNEILNNIDNPEQLEKLYRDNKAGFQKEFDLIYDDLKGNKLAEFWNVRLNYEANQASDGKDEISWGTRRELLVVICFSLLAGLVAKLPAFFSIDEEFFYQRNLGLIIFPLLTAYFLWRNKTATSKVMIAAITTIVASVYINFLPGDETKDTLVLACVHMPLLLWAISGFSFVADDWSNIQKRLDFLRYNGDLAVITAIILIAGAILTGITIGIFSLIGFDIADFYIEYVVVFGLAAAPFVGTYVIRTNPQLVSKVSPVIARIFSPLVLITLVIYIVAIIFSGKDPYNDREFLMLFNALLIGVVAIIVFSIAEASGKGKGRMETTILFLLSAVTSIVGAIALSAIAYRIATWGITPNRLAVFGGNLLILINLSIVSYRLFKTVRQPEQIGFVGKSIATFLPIYSLWTMVVIFIFPLIFWFD